MKKKCYIETVEDIKYCEENGLKIYSDTWEPDFFKFDNGVWCMYSDNELKFYNSSFDVSYDDLYYYKEESEEQQEATETDVGKLCWFYDREEIKVVGILREVLSMDDTVPFRSDYGITSMHCRPLTKEEIKKFMEKAE